MALAREDEVPLALENRENLVALAVTPRSRDPVPELENRQGNGFRASFTADVPPDCEPVTACVRLSLSEPEDTATSGELDRHRLR
jgi:hypothetical protein